MTQSTTTPEQTTTHELTLNDLRRACKAIGVTVTKKTLSWGPHITFKIDGRSVESVHTREFYEEHKDTFERLELIREQFSELRVDGQKTYGVTTSTRG